MEERLRGLGLKIRLSALADLALPRVCICCGDSLTSFEQHLCLDCLANLPETYFYLYSHNPMSDRLNDKLEKYRTDNDNNMIDNYSYACALYFYRNGLPYKNISQDLKYRRNIKAGRYFAIMLAQRLVCSPLYADVDAVLPVPLHWTRKWSRGYNQAEIIARSIASSLGCPCLNKILIRRRRTRSQTHLRGSLEKAKNVSGVFSLRNKELLRSHYHILLVDDVFTTGATLSECVIALRSCLDPSIRISIASLGFVGE